ncbi:MAG: hypothetical protein KBD00_03365 [Candidatus Peribacteraceae bacterium]|nr:hypothetical protein [Candidatus Peribacteraceae bacterium]
MILCFQEGSDYGILVHEQIINDTKNLAITQSSNQAVFGAGLPDGKWSIHIRTWLHDPVNINLDPYSKVVVIVHGLEHGEYLKPN